MFRHYLIMMILLASALLSSACAYQGVSVESSPPLSKTSQVSDRQVLAGEWEYIDPTGAVVLLTLDEQGNGHYQWNDGRFETHRLIDHTWSGKWFQEVNDRDGEFTIQLSPDFSEGEGRWWYSRIGTNRAPTQKGGTFHLRSSAVSG
jgi:hypothetical protein